MCVMAKCVFQCTVPRVGIQRLRGNGFPPPKFLQQERCVSSSPNEAPRLRAAAKSVRAGASRPPPEFFFPSVRSPSRPAGGLARRIRCSGKSRLSPAWGRTRPKPCSPTSNTAYRCGIRCCVRDPPSFWSPNAILSRPHDDEGPLLFSVGVLVEHAGWFLMDGLQHKRGDTEEQDSRRPFL